MACQWAQEHVGGHKGELADTRACQWAQGRVSGNKGMLVGTRACQWTFSGYKFTLEAVHL